MSSCLTRNHTIKQTYNKILVHIKQKSHQEGCLLHATWEEQNERESAILDKLNVNTSI